MNSTPDLSGKIINISLRYHEVPMIKLILGLQFGDEGKGKITDFVSDEKSILVRYNGGTNAGHTVVTDRGKFKFHLLPAGSLRAKTVVLGNGMVIDPFALIEEIKGIIKENLRLDIRISSAASVVTDLHKNIDREQENLRGDMKIGTTSHGIGPTYEEKYSRNGIRISDLSSLETIIRKLRLIREIRQSELRNSPYLEDEKLLELAKNLHSTWDFIGKFVCSTETFLMDSVEKGEKMIFEGGHGSLLDIDFGTYPYVTSSNTISGSMHTGSGISLRKVNTIIGVVKSYTSRVGEGPFPTELHGNEAESLRTAGGEYGTTTGRPRRVGWLDIPLIRYASSLNDIDELAMTKLDVLGSRKIIKICTSYGKKINNPMNALLGAETAEPEYIEMDGWGTLGNDEIEKIVSKGYDSVPEKMKEYIETVEKLVGKKISIVSIGQIRGSTILKK